MSNFKKYIDILTLVVTGKVSGKEAIEQLPQAQNDEILNRIWHDLYHLSVDTDIHNKDESYKNYQMDLLKNHIEELKNKT